MKKLFLLAVAGAGYVLGAKAGRQRYEQIKSTFIKVKDNPTVQEKAHQVADVAKEQAPVMKDKVVGAAGAAAAKVRPGSNGTGDDLADQLNPDSTVHQGDKAYPQGDLP
jgi:hypothetical protein